MKTIIIACLTTASILGIYFSQSFWAPKKKGEVQGQELSRKITVVSPKIEVKPNPEKTIIQEEKNIKKLEISTKVKSKKPKTKEQKKENITDRRQFKELLEDNIEFIEMT